MTRVAVLTPLRRLQLLVARTVNGVTTSPKMEPPTSSSTSSSSSSSSSLFDLVPSSHVNQQWGRSEREVIFTQAQVAVSKNLVEAFFRDVRVNDVLMDLVQSIDELGPAVASSSDWLRLKALCLFELQHMAPSSIVTVLDLLTKHGVCGQVEAAQLQNALARADGFASLSVSEQVEFLYHVCAVDRVVLSAALLPQVLTCIPAIISQCEDADLPPLAYVLGTLLYDAGLSERIGSVPSPPEYNMHKAFLERVMQSTNLHGTLRASERIHLLFNCVRFVRRKHASTSSLDKAEMDTHMRETRNHIQMREQEEEELFSLQRVVDVLLFNLRYSNNPPPTGPKEAMYNAGFGGLLGSVVILGGGDRVECSLRYAEVHAQLRSIPPKGLLQLFSAVHDYVALRTRNGGIVDLLAAGARVTVQPRDGSALLSPVHPRLFATAGECGGEDGGTTALKDMGCDTMTCVQLQRMSDVMDALSRRLLLVLLRCEIADTFVLVMMLQRLTRSGAMHLSKNTQLLQHLLIRALLYGYGDAIFPGPWLDAGSIPISGSSSEQLFIVPPACGMRDHTNNSKNNNNNNNDRRVEGGAVRCDGNAILGWRDTDPTNALIARLGKSILIDGDFLVRSGISNPAELLVVAETLARYPLAHDYQEVYARIIAQKLPTAVMRLSSELDNITRLLAAVSALGTINTSVCAAVREVVRTLKAPPDLHRKWNAILEGKEEERGGGETDVHNESSEPAVVKQLSANEIALKCCNDCVVGGVEARRQAFQAVELLAEKDGLESAESSTCRIVLRFLACTTEGNENLQPYVSHRSLDAIHAFYDRGLGEALREARGGSCVHLLEHLSCAARLGVSPANLARSLPVLSECLTRAVRSCMVTERGETCAQPVDASVRSLSLVQHILAFVVLVYELQAQPSIVHPHLRVYLRRAIVDSAHKDVSLKSSSDIVARLFPASDVTAPGRLLSTITALLYAGEDHVEMMERFMSALAIGSDIPQCANELKVTPHTMWLPAVEFTTAVSRCGLASWFTSSAIRERLLRQLLRPLLRAASREALECRHARNRNGSAAVQSVSHPPDAHVSLAAATATALLTLDTAAHEMESHLHAECVQLREQFGRMAQRLFVESEGGPEDGSMKWSLASINRTLAGADDTFGTPGISHHAQIMIIAQGIQAAAKRDTELKQHLPLSVAVWKQCVKRMDKVAQRVSQSTGDDNALLFTVAVALHFGISSQGTDAITNRFLPPSGGTAKVKAPAPQPATVFAPRPRVEPRSAPPPRAAPPSPAMRRTLTPASRVNAQLTSLIAAGLVESGKRRPAATAFVANAVQTSDLSTLPAHALHSLIAFITRDAERVALGQTQADSLAVLLWSRLDLKLTLLSPAALVRLLPSTPTYSREYMLRALGSSAPAMTLSEICKCVKMTADWEMGSESLGESNSAVEFGGIRLALIAYYASVRRRMDGMAENHSAVDKECITEIEAFVGKSESRQDG